MSNDTSQAGRNEKAPAFTRVASPQHKAGASYNPHPALNTLSEPRLQRVGKTPTKGALGTSSPGPARPRSRAEDRSGHDSAFLTRLPERLPPRPAGQAARAAPGASEPGARGARGYGASGSRAPVNNSRPGRPRTPLPAAAATSRRGAAAAPREGTHRAGPPPEATPPSPDPRPSRAGSRSLTGARARRGAARLTAASERGQRSGDSLSPRGRRPVSSPPPRPPATPRQPGPAPRAPGSAA